MSTDALSGVLSAARLSGLIFFDATAKSPWVAEAPPGAQPLHMPALWRSLQREPPHRAQNADIRRQGALAFLFLNPAIDART
jgi:hypothetical protein